MQVLITDIKLPDLYIRGEVHKPYVAELAELFDDKSKAEFQWPFKTKVTLRKRKKANDLDKGFEIVDGVNRLYATVQIGQKSVDADVVTLTDEEALLAQLTMNAGHGLRLDRHKRDTWVRMLIEKAHIPVTEIKKLTGLSDASVSRIKTGKQTKIGPRKKAVKGKGKGKGKKKTTAAATSSDAWSSQDWFPRLGMALSSYFEHKGELIPRMHPKMLTDLRTMTADFTTYHAAHTT